MLEVALVAVSLILLSYTLYMAYQALIVQRSGKGPWKWIYSLVIVMVMITFFMFGMVLFALYDTFLKSFTVTLDNLMFAIILVSGAGLTTAMLKYHFSVK